MEAKVALALGKTSTNGTMRTLVLELGGYTGITWKLQMVELVQQRMATWYNRVMIGIDFWYKVMVVVDSWHNRVMVMLDTWYNKVIVGLQIFKARVVDGAL